MTEWTFTAVPLTPIHVGDGTAWPAEELSIEGTALCRFDPERVMADMAPAARKDYLDLLARGDLHGAQRVLRDAVVRERHVLEKIPVGGGEARDIDDGLGDRARRTTVRGFVRSGGRPYLPGSSIKGAIRTAVVSALAQQFRDRLGTIAPDPPHAPPRDAHRTLEKTALGLEDGDTERDFFRFVHVADAPLPANSTQIERVYNWTPRKRNDMLIYVERLRSAADEGDYPKFEIKLKIDDRHLARVERLAAVSPVGRKVDATHPDPQVVSVWGALNFYVRRWETELRGGNTFRYFADLPGTRDRLDRAWKRLTTGEFAGRKQFRILRVGRFSHFESLSVDEFRLGQRRGARGQVSWVQEGSSRAVVSIGGALIPFGWLALFRNA